MQEIETHLDIELNDSNLAEWWHDDEYKTVEWNGN